MNVRTFLLPLLASVLVVASACTTVHVNPTAPVAPAAGSTAAADSAKSPFKPWAEVTKDARSYAGLLTLHLKRDLTLYAELRSDQLETDLGLVMHYSRGVGDYDLHVGLPLSDMRLVRFRRVGDAVHLVHVNPRFVVDDASDLRLALEQNTGNSIIASFKIESVHDQTKHLLVDLTPFLVSDYADIGSSLKSIFEDKPLTPESEKSFVERVFAFEKNVEVDATLSFKTPGRSPAGADALSDYRSIPVGVRYSIIALPEVPMTPRLADDRVGHFVSAFYDFSREQMADPYVRYVNRWRLEKKNPEAALSEPVKPIVFYIDHSVPKAYHQYVKEGIEAWNKGFERAGFRNAIQAREAPDDSLWSAEDARYSTVRWTAGYRMGYAIGPSQMDPRTGEILNADILISSEFVRGWANSYELLGKPESFRRYLDPQEMADPDMPDWMRHRLCMAQSNFGHQLGFQHAALGALGVVDAGQPLPGEFLGDAIRDLVMHEIGHGLGLRHNFRASSGVPNDRLHDVAFTREHGVALSVMDYTPVNVSVDPAAQGHYYNKELGTYDVWAIRYAYTPVEGEAAAVRASRSPAALTLIAAEGTSPLHTYNTDEDTWLGAHAVDPLSNAYDLGADPLAFARDRSALVQRITPTVDARLIPEGDGYQRLRAATTRLIVERTRALQPLTKMVGGLYFHRDHKGDPDARPPFEPVPAARQREAVALITAEAFAPGAFAFEPELLNKLAPNRHSHWGVGWMSVPVDFPVHDYVGGVQASLLNALMHPVRLRRMLDNEVRVEAGSDVFRVSELLRALSTAIWSELDAVSAPPPVVDTFRRNLQRAYTDRLIQLLLNRPTSFAAAQGDASVPEHARSLARLELEQLLQRVNRALDAGRALDADARAHLVESRARIDRALNAPLQLTLPESL